MLQAAEARIGFRLPEDMRAFYRATDGASLHAREDSPYRILPLEEMHRTRIDIYGEDTDRWGPASWYSIIGVQDGNFISFEILPERGQAIFIDAFHETFGMKGECNVVALSFTELLELSLRGPRHFYLDAKLSARGSQPFQAPSFRTR